MIIAFALAWILFVVPIPFGPPTSATRQTISLITWSLAMWAPALAHGSLNATAGLPLLFLTGVDITLGGTLASLIGWIPLALFVAWLVWTNRLPVPLEMEAGLAPPGASQQDVSRETSTAE